MVQSMQRGVRCQAVRPSRRGSLSTTTEDAGIRATSSAVFTRTYSGSPNPLTTNLSTVPDLVSGALLRDLEPLAGVSVDRHGVRQTRNLFLQ